jgi:hypothetical protein
MKHLLLVASCLLAFGGCKKSGIDGKLDDLAKIRDAMCACKDKACADKQHDAYIAWKKGNSKDDKPSDDQMKKFHEIRDALHACRHKLDAPEGAAPATP